MVKNHETGIVNFTGSYYNYETIEDSLNKKSKNIVFIFAESSGKEKDEKFKFIHGYVCLDGMNLCKFIDFYNKRKISYDIRLGTYESEKNKGKFHDTVVDLEYFQRIYTLFIRKLLKFNFTLKKQWYTILFFV